MTDRAVSEMPGKPGFALTKVAAEEVVPVAFPGEWEPDDIVPPSEGVAQE